jgi:hypothetical protein
MENELQDRYGIGEEKLDWLQEIGAKELKEPYVYSADYGQYYMSERYLRETPLCKLKEIYESNKVKTKDYQNFDSRTGKKQNPTCPYCWVLKEDNHNCGYEKCPGYDLPRLMKLKAE